MFFKTTLIGQTGQEQLLVIAPNETHVKDFCQSEMSAYGLIDFSVECVSKSSTYHPEDGIKIKVVGF